MPDCRAGCSGKSEQKGEGQTAAKADARPQVKISLVGKALPEIKESVNGKWELISGDTLYIQDCTATAYKYMLLRR